MIAARRTVYLAGPMDYGHDDYNLYMGGDRKHRPAEWRQSVMSRAKCCEYKIPEMVELECESHEYESMEIPRKDLELIRQSSALVALIDRLDRFGTFCEIAAAKALGLKVSAVIMDHNMLDTESKYKVGNTVPWFVYSLLDDERYASGIDDAIDHLVELCGGDSIDYHEYINSPAWKEKAKAAKIAANYRCQICNTVGTDSTLNAHHRTYERLGNELPKDITVLCKKCHELFSKNGKLAKV